MEHELGGGIGMVEREGGFVAQGEGVLVEGDNVDAVGVALDEGAEGEARGAGGREGGEGHGVYRVGGIEGVHVRRRRRRGFLGRALHSYPI